MRRDYKSNERKKPPLFDTVGERFFWISTILCAIIGILASLYVSSRYQNVYTSSREEFVRGIFQKDSLAEKGKWGNREYTASSVMFSDINKLPPSENRNCHDFLAVRINPSIYSDTGLKIALKKLDTVSDVRVDADQVTIYRYCPEKELPVSWTKVWAPAKLVMKHWLYLK